MTVLNELALFSESCSVDIPVERSCSTQEADKWYLGIFWPLPKCHQYMKHVHQKYQYDVPQLWGEVLFPPSLPRTRAAAIPSHSSKCIDSVFVCCSAVMSHFYVHCSCHSRAYTPCGGHASLIRRTVPNRRHAELMCTPWKHFANQSETRCSKLVLWLKQKWLSELNLMC